LSNNHATFIWSIADLLRGSFKAHQYGDIILPFTVLRRLDAVLAPTKQAVFAAVEEAAADEIPVRRLFCVTRLAMSTLSGTSRSSI
jgi:type I restriction enzyme M protein